jgi:hypothetical protein
MKLENRESYDIICEGCNKKLTRFYKSCYIQYLQSKETLKKFHDVEAI